MTEFVGVRRACPAWRCSAAAVSAGGEHRRTNWLDARPPRLFRSRKVCERGPLSRRSPRPDDDRRRPAEALPTTSTSARRWRRCDRRSRAVLRRAQQRQREGKHALPRAALPNLRPRPYAVSVSARTLLGRHARSGFATARRPAPKQVVASDSRSRCHQFDLAVLSCAGAISTSSL